MLRGQRKPPNHRQAADQVRDVSCLRAPQGGGCRASIASTGHGVSAAPIRGPTRLGSSSWQAIAGVLTGHDSPMTPVLPITVSAPASPPPH